MSAVGVHGVRQYQYHRDPGVLERMWATALSTSTGMAKADFVLAYYAEALHKGTPQGQNALAELTAFERDLMAAWLADVGVPHSVRQGPATAWLRDGLDWLVVSGRAEGLTQAVAAATFREVGTYLDPLNGLRRDKARRVVAEVVTSAAPSVLLAHSLGSVVAYEALWAWPNLRVDLLVTLGSPLALPGVFLGRLDPAGAGLCQRPPGVRSWINIADEGDLVAIPKRLGDHFAGVDRDVEVRIGTVAFHGIEAYLRCPGVAEVLRPWLGRVS